MSEIEQKAKALEDEFFRRQDEAAIAKLRAAREREHALEELKAATGVEDQSVLEALLEAGVDATTHPALMLVPLAAVAWASGSVEDAEREALMRAARNAGVAEGSAADDFLGRLLEKPVDDGLVAVWEAYVAALASNSGQASMSALRSGIISRGREIAEAAGGFLGLNTVSIAESEMLERIEAALSVDAN